MSNSCQFLAPNGEASLLYKQLAARFGDERAAFLWNHVRTPQWQSKHGWWTDVERASRSTDTSQLAGTEVTKFAQFLAKKINLPIRVENKPGENWAAKYTSRDSIVFNKARFNYENGWHEIAHPILIALKLEDRNKFLSLYEELQGTEEWSKIYQQAYDKVLKLYNIPAGSDLFVEEVLATAIGLALGKKTEVTSRFMAIIGKILDWIAKMLSLSNANVITRDMLAGMSLQQLVDVMYSDDYVFDLGKRLQLSDDVTKSEQELADSVKKLHEPLQKLFTQGLLPRNNAVYAAALAKDTYDKIHVAYAEARGNDPRTFPGTWNHNNMHLYSRLKEGLQADLGFAHDRLVNDISNEFLLNESGQTQDIFKKIFDLREEDTLPKVPFTSKFIDSLNKGGKVDLTKPFSVSGASASELAVLKEFYDHYIERVKAFFKDKPIPKSGDAGRIKSAYIDWLNENYPLEMIKTDTATQFTYGLRSVIKDTTGLKNGYEVLISNNKLYKYGHTYKIQDLPDQYNGIGWFIYHELYGKTPLIYELQSDMLDEDYDSLIRDLVKAKRPLTQRDIPTLQRLKEALETRRGSIESYVEQARTQVLSSYYPQNIAPSYKKIRDLNLGNIVNDVRNAAIGHDTSVHEVLDLMQQLYYDRAQTGIRYRQLHAIMEEYVKYEKTLPQNVVKKIHAIMQEGFDSTGTKGFPPTAFVNYSRDQYGNSVTSLNDLDSLHVDYHSRGLANAMAKLHEANFHTAANLIGNMMGLAARQESNDAYTSILTNYSTHRTLLASVTDVLFAKGRQKTIAMNNVLGLSRTYTNPIAMGVRAAINKLKTGLEGFSDEEALLQLAAVYRTAEIYERTKDIFNSEVQRWLSDGSWAAAPEFKKLLIDSGHDAVTKMIAIIDDALNKLDKGLMVTDAMTQEMDKLIKQMTSFKSYQLRYFIESSLQYAKSQGKTEVFFPTAEFIEEVESGDPWTLYVTREEAKTEGSKYYGNHVGGVYEALEEIKGIKWKTVSPEWSTKKVLLVDLSNYGDEITRFSKIDADGNIEDNNSLNSQGEPSLSKVMGTIDDQKVEQPAVVSTIVDMGDPMNPFSPNYIVKSANPTVLFEVDNLKREGQVESLEHLVTIQMLAFVPGLSMEQYEGMLSVLLGNQQLSHVAVMALRNSIMDSENFDSQLWRSKRYQVFRSAMYTFVRGSDEAKRFLLDSWGTALDIVGMPHMSEDEREDFTRALYDVREYLYTGGDDTYTKELRVTSYELGRSVTIVQPNGAYMQPEDYVEALQTISFAIQNILLAPGNQNIDLATLREKVKSRLMIVRKQMEAISQGKVTPGITADQASRALSNLDRLFQKYSTKEYRNKTLLERLIGRALNTTQLSSFGLSVERLTEQLPDDEKVNEDKGGKNYSKPFYSVAPHNTAGLRVKAWLLRIPDMTMTPIQSKHVNVPFSNRSQLQLLVADPDLGKYMAMPSNETGKWPVTAFRGAHRKLVLRDGDTLIKSIGLLPGEYGVMSVATSGSAKRHILIRAVDKVSMDDSELQEAIKYNNVTGKDNNIMAYEIVDEYIPGGVKGTPRYNSYGIKAPADFNKLFNQLLEEFSNKGQLTIEKTFEVLSDSKNPVIRQVGDQLKDEYYRTKDDSLMYDFITAMSQVRMSMRRVLIRVHTDGETGYTAGMTISPVSSERNSNLRILQHNWRNAQRYLPVTTVLSDNSYAMDIEILGKLQQKVKAFYDQISEPQFDMQGNIVGRYSKTRDPRMTEEAIDLANEVLSSHGIYLPRPALEALISNANQYSRGIRDFKWDFAGLFSFDTYGNPSGIISAFTLATGENPMDKYGSTLRTLANLYLSYDQYSFAKAFRDINNNMVWPFGQPAYVNNVQEMLSSGEYQAMHARDPFHQSNPWLTNEIQVNKLKNMKIHLQDGINTQTRERGRARENMTAIDQDVMLMSLFFNDNAATAMYMSVTHSDKPLSYVYELPIDRVAERMWSNRNGQIVFSNYANGAMYSLIQMEYSRITQGTTRGDKMWHLVPGMSSQGLLSLVQQQRITAEEYNLFYDNNGVLRDHILSTENLPVLFNRIIPNLLFDVVQRQLNAWEINKTLTPNKALPVSNSVLSSYSRDIMAGGLASLELKPDQVNMALAMDYTLSRYFFNAQALTAMFGDPALIYASKMDKLNDEMVRKAISDEYSKRLAGPIAPGRKPAVEAYAKPFARTLLIADPNIFLDELGVTTNTIADAQEFMTVREWLSGKLAFGEISQALYREMIEVVNEGEKTGYYRFTEKAHLDVVRQIEKWVSYGPRVGQDGRVEHDYVKSSTMILYPPSLGTGLNRLRIYMEANKIDRAHMTSARKLGLKGKAAQIFDKDGNIVPELASMDLSQSISDIDRRYMLVQQYVPYDEIKARIRIVTQANKNILDLVGVLLKSPVKLVRSGRELSPYELISHKENIVKRMLLTKVNKELTRLGAMAGADMRVSEVSERIVRDIMAEKARQLNFTDVQLASIIHKAGKEYTIPILYNNSYGKLQSLLMNTINRALQLYIPGHSYVQSTSAGMVMSDEGLDRNTDVIFIEGHDTSRRLRSMIKSPGTDAPTVAHAEILIPWNFRDEKGELIDINKFVKEVNGKRVLDMSKIDQSILSIIGMRIPNQSHNSMLAFKIVGFLPQAEGSRAVVPADIARQMGADFDLDKLYSYMYMYKLDNGRLIVDDSEENMYVNEYVELFESILTHPDMYDKVMKSIDTPLLEEARKPYIGKIWTGSMLEPAYQDQEYLLQKEASELIGVFAKLKTFDPNLQVVDMPLARSEKIMNDKGVIIPRMVELSLPLFIRDGNVIQLQQLSGYGKIESDGTVYYKGDHISALLGESVDYAKNRTLDYTNINITTAELVTALVMLQSGNNDILSMHEILAFLHQPVVYRFIELSRDGFIGAGGYRNKNEILVAISAELGLTTYDEYPDLSVIKPMDLADYKSMTQKSISELSEEEIIKQRSVFVAMRALMEAGRSLRELQAQLDADVKGLGKNPFLGKQYLTTSSKLVDEYSGKKVGFLGANQLLYTTRKLTPTTSVAVEDNRMSIDGRTEKGAYNHLADKLYHAIIPSIFPIESVFTIINVMKTRLGIPAYSPIEEDLFDDVIESIRAWVTVKGLSSLEQLRERLTSRNMAKRLLDLKNNPAHRANQWLQGLDVNETGPKSSDPIVIRFRGHNFMDVTDGLVYQDFVDAATNEDVELRNFTRDMVFTEFMAGNTQNSYSFARYIHPIIYENLGIAELYRKDYADQKSNPGDWLTANRTFMDNFMQHNPEYSRRVSGEQLKEDFNVPVIDLTTKLTGESVDQDLYAILYDEDQSKIVEYFHVNVNGEIQLYHRVQGYRYARLPLLGNRLMSEFGVDDSILPEHRVNHVIPVVRLDAPYTNELPAPMNFEEQLQLASSTESNAADADLAILGTIVRNNTISDQALRQLADVLMQFPITDPNFKIKPSDKNKGAATYDVLTSTLHIDPSRVKDEFLHGEHADKTLEHVYVHESVHARLNHAIYTAPPAMLARMDQLIDYASYIYQKQLGGTDQKISGMPDFMLTSGTNEDNMRRRFEWMVLAATDPAIIEWLNGIDYSGIGGKRTLLDHILDVLHRVLELFLDKKAINPEAILNEFKHLNNMLLQNQSLLYTSHDVQMGNDVYKVWALNGVAHHVTLPDNSGLFRKFHNTGKVNSVRDKAFLVFNRMQNRPTVIVDASGNRSNRIQAEVSYPIIDVFGEDNNGLFDLGQFMMNEEQQTATLDLIDNLSPIFTLGRIDDLPFELKSWLITGQGGTGKTTIVKKAIAHLAAKYGLNPAQLKYIVPTHTAGIELSQSLGYDQNVASTTASILGAYPELADLTEGELFKQVFKDGNTADLSEAKLIVVDEASMISDSDWDKLETAMKDSIVIVIGDPLQNLAIGNTDVSAPLRKLLEAGRSSTLLKNMRARFQDLSRVILQYRDEAIKTAQGTPYSGVPPVRVVENSENVTYINKKSDIVPMFLKPERFEAEDPYNQLILTARNEGRIAVNALVRQHRFGNAAAPWMPGDHAIQRGNELIPVDAETRRYIGKGFSKMKFLVTSFDRSSTTVQHIIYKMVPRQGITAFTRVLPGMDKMGIKMAPRFRKADMPYEGNIALFPAYMKSDVFLNNLQSVLQGLYNREATPSRIESWLVDYLLSNNVTPELFDPVGQNVIYLDKMNGEERNEVYTLLNDLRSMISSNNVDYAYATNSHDAQGATYNHVVFIDADARKARRPSDDWKARANYTSASRASKSIVIYNDAFDIKGFRALDSAFTMIQATTGEQGIVQSPVTQNDKEVLENTQADMGVNMTLTSNFTRIKKTGEKEGSIAGSASENLLNMLTKLRDEYTQKISQGSSTIERSTVESYRVQRELLDTYIATLRVTSNLAEVLPIAEKQLDWVENTMKAGMVGTFNNLSWNDMNLMHSVTQLWSNISSKLFFESINNQPSPFRMLFHDLENRANTLHDSVVSSISNAIMDRFEIQQRGDFRTNYSERGNKAGLLFQSITNSSNEVLSKISSLVYKQMIQRDAEIQDLNKRLDGMKRRADELGGMEAVWKALTRQGKTKSGYKEWGMITEYTGEYYRNIASLWASLRRAINAAERNINSTPSQMHQAIEYAFNQFFKEKNKFQVHANILVLFDDKGELKNDTAAVSEMNRLSTELGKDPSELINRAQALYKRWLIQREAYMDDLDKQLSVGIIKSSQERDQKLEEYDQRYNPERFFTGIVAFGKAKMHIGRFVASAPKRVVDGQPSGFYDDSYDQLMRATDSRSIALRTWMEDYKKLVSEAKEILPEEYHNRIHEGFIPAIEKKMMAKGFSLTRYVADTTSPDKFTAPEWEEALMYGRILPVKFINDSRGSLTSDEYDRMSHDLIRNMEMFMSMATHYKHANAVFEQAQAFDKLLHETQHLLSSYNMDAVTNTINAWEYFINKNLFLVPTELEMPVGKPFRFMTPALINKDKKAYDDLKEEKMTKLDEAQALEYQINTGAIDIGTYINKISDINARISEIDTELSEIQKRNPNKQLYLSKAADHLIKLQQMSTFSWNPFTAASNLTMSLVSAGTQAAGEQVRDDGSLVGYTRKTYSWAVRKLTQAMFTRDHLILDRVFGFMDRGNMMGELVDAWHGNTNLKSYKKWWQSELFNPYVLMQKGDFFVRAAVTLAYLTDQKATTASGKEISLFEAIDQSADWDSSKHGDNESWNPTNREEFAKHVARIQRLLEPITGATDQRKRVLAKKSVIGRLLGQFRLTWIPEGAASRFAPEHYDAILDASMKGRYITYSDLGFGNSLKALWMMFLERSIPGMKGRNFNNIVLKHNGKGLMDSHVDMANMRKNYYEAIIALRVLALMALLTYAQDDEEDKSSYASKLMLFMLNLVFRQYQDLTFFVNPSEATNLLRLAVPSVSVLNNFGKFMSATYKYLDSELGSGEEYTAEEWLYRFTSNSVILPQMSFINKIRTVTTRDISTYNR